MNLTLDGPGGPWGFAPGDLSTTLEYLGLAAQVVARYARQYGPTQLTVSPEILPFRVKVGAPQYSDHQLQTWVNELVQEQGLSTEDAVVVLNPPGVVNTDARERGGVGVLGYHGLAEIPYSFVNALGSGFTVEDHADVYAEALSHELAEMVVDPRADDGNPEVCDGCGTNCQGASAFRAFFDSRGTYLSSSSTFPPGIPYRFFVSAIARPRAATACPAPSVDCAYPPP